MAFHFKIPGQYFLECFWHALKGEKTYVKITLPFPQPGDGELFGNAAAAALLRKANDIMELDKCIMAG